MLDVMRKHSRSFFIYILFGIIIAVFVINFGAGSRSGSGCTPATVSSARVTGRTISHQVLEYAVSSMNINTQSLREEEMVRIRSLVMDLLIRRELLADAALSAGLRVSDKEIDDMLIKGRYLAMGQPKMLIHAMDEKGNFDYDRFSRYVRYAWRLTALQFKDEQRRELLAEKYMQILRTATKVSSAEVRNDYEQRNSQVTLSYVRFLPRDFRGKVVLSPEKAQQYLSSHADKVKQHYEENKKTYEMLPDQVRLQLLLVKADLKNDAAKQQARAAADAAAKRIAAGEDFTKVAQSASTDEETKAGGGQLDWLNEDSPGLGDEGKKLLPTVKTGQVSPVFQADNGFALVKVVARRKGTLSFEQAKLYVAEELLWTDEALRMASAEAARYVALAKQGKKLEDLFQAEGASGNPSEGNKKEVAADGTVGATAENKDPTQAAAEKDAAPKAAPVAASERSSLPLSSTSSFSRSSTYHIEGIGTSKELMDAAFKLKKGEVASRPFEVNDGVYLVAAKDRTEPDWADFKKRSADLAEELANRRFSSRINAYVAEKCDKAVEDNRIRISPGLFAPRGVAPAKGEKPIRPPAPCSSLKESLM